MFPSIISSGRAKHPFTEPSLMMPMALIPAKQPIQHLLKIPGGVLSFGSSFVKYPMLSVIMGRSPRRPIRRLTVSITLGMASAGRAISAHPDARPRGIVS